MIKIFTEDDLLRFLYDEMSAEERDDLNQAILTDGQLEKTVQEMAQIKKQLDQVRLKAPAHLVNNVMCASRQWRG
jgi:hypothetical protein